MRQVPAPLSAAAKLTFRARAVPAASSSASFRKVAAPRFDHFGTEPLEPEAAAALSAVSFCEVAAPKFDSIEAKFDSYDAESLARAEAEAAAVASSFYSREVAAARFDRSEEEAAAASFAQAVSEINASFAHAVEEAARVIGFARAEAEARFAHAAAEAARIVDFARAEAEARFARAAAAASSGSAHRTPKSAAVCGSLGSILPVSAFCFDALPSLCSLPSCSLIVTPRYAPGGWLSLNFQR